MYRSQGWLPRIAGVLTICLVGFQGAVVAAPLSGFIDEPAQPVYEPPEEPLPPPPAPEPVPEQGSGATGRSFGYARVSPAGEARYSIPLSLPSGTNGLTPRLSLEYGHANASGDLGAGWSVGGLSRIARCRRTIAQDGAPGPVALSQLDRFCLDGQRLVIANGQAYGSNGAEYRTEIESFARIRTYGTAGSGPRYFVVEAADGLVLEYGATADSRIDWSGKVATPRAWALSRMRDRAGNAIDYSYTEDAVNGSFRIATVRYNGNPSAGVTPTHEVAFSYENRPVNEADLGYVAGLAISQAVRLARIELLYNGSVLRRHELGYAAALSTTGRSRLVSLRECAGGDCLAPTSMTWQDGRPGFGPESAQAAAIGGNAWIAESKRWWAADVNGDGRADLVWAGGSLDAATLRFRLALASGGHGPEIDTRIGAPNGVGVPLDYDGDGTQDALLVSRANRWQVVLGGSSGLGTVIETGIAATGGDFRGADLDGDGLSDLAYTELVGTSGNGLQVRVRYNKRGLGFSQSPVTLYEQGYHAGYEHAEGGEFLGRPGQRIDLDGDGREDLLMNENYSIARISADQRLSEPFASSFAGGVPADVNGDGCTDFAYPHYQGKWRVRFSGCTVNGPYGIEIAGPAYGTLRHVVATIDWNGDGRDDLLFGDTTSTWKVVQSAGASLLPVADTGVAHGSPTSVVVADMNGDGLQDLATRSGSRLGYRLHQGPVPDLLSSVTDGFGVTARFDYAVTTDPAIHTKGSGATYPQRDVQEARSVVSRLSVSDGSGSDSLARTTYTYAGLRRDLAGRGDLGFARRVSREVAPAPGLVIEEVYRQDHPFVGRSARQVVRLANGRLARETSREWKALSYGGGYTTRLFPYVTSSREMHFDPTGSAPGAAHTTVTASVAAIDRVSGLVTDDVTTVTEGVGGDHPGATRSERTQHGSVLNDTTHWCLGRPTGTRITASHSLNGGASVTRSHSLAWDGLACRITRQQVEPGDARWQVTINFAYDVFGNPTRRTVTGAAMSSRTTSIDWGARGRFPMTIRNPLSQATKVLWDESYGLPIAMTDPNGLVSRWNYDAFGNLMLETRPDGTRVAWSRASCDADCDPRARYQLRRNEQDAAGAATHAIVADVDRFERVLRVAKQAAGGTYAEESVEFDGRGRVARHHAPRWSGGPGSGSWRFGYDELDRLTSASMMTVSGAIERLLRYEHDGLRITEIDPRGNRTTRHQAAWGDLVSVTDALGGTSRYEYGAFGELLRVRDALGNTTSAAAYNVRGMKTAQSDMDLGAWTLSPNALGEVVSWTDAKAQTTVFSYDALGRPISRAEAEGVTRWTWGSSAAAHNIGRLASITGPGYSESYTYDSRARLATRTVNSDSSYQFGYTYNQAGHVDTLTYPVSTAGYRLKIGYEYQHGQLVRIRNKTAQGAVLWQLEAADPAGNVLDESLGTAVRVVSGFNPLTGLLEYRQAGRGGGTAMQDLSYRWDAAGNLLERRDRTRNLNEAFIHDAVNRLSATTLNGASGLTLRYDPLGNITWKSDVCPTASPCYSYHATRRHAVTAAGSGRYAYDANGNMTSRNGSSVTWYSYNLPKSIAQQGGNASQFWYDPLRRRWKQSATHSGTSETTIYVGGLLEKVTRGGSVTWRHYVQGPTGTAAIHLRYASGSPARTYHPTRDHLGGTDRIVDGATGATVVAESFDAFGRRRGNDGSAGPTSTEWAAIQSSTRDGFAGHEHLDNLALVHMNGRVYDPKIGRFLSADPIVQAPYDGQDLNRYSYAWNNPLAVIDPSGLEEVQCLHGPDGRCQGVTVTGLRDGGSTAMYQLWRSGGNGQVASAAQRDPCGQYGSAMDCAHAVTTQPAGRSAAREHPPLEPGECGGLLARSGRAVGRPRNEFGACILALPGLHRLRWFPVPPTELGERGALLGGVGDISSAGVARTLRLGGNQCRH